MSIPALQQAFQSLVVSTSGRGFTEITGEVASWLRAIEADAGVLTLFVRHTSASLTIQENADPDVTADLTDSLDRLAPEDLDYRHRQEGPDDMPAHVKSMLTATSLQVPVMASRMQLGTWQGIYLIEHRAHPHRREVVIAYQGTRRSP